MTTFLPLEPAKPLPATPSFLVAASDPEAQMAKVIKAILKAKRVVIICGAGISVDAGIPDFRSPEGLFQTLKRDNPREQLTSGRDLFDASVFNSEQTTSLFCQMIARLSSLSMAATPTPFHHLLRSLDDRGRLLRVYTQNIDAIEVKAGLSFGVPESKPLSKTKLSAESSVAGSTPQTNTRLPSPPLDFPRCIPLHGTIQTIHCQTCTHKFPLEVYLPSLGSGFLPQCPECTQMEETRQVIGKRARGVGKLRPSVVLYNEIHQQGEWVGEVVQRDLMGSSKGKGRNGADLLLVVGTSLRVPGTKRMVREFAKAVRARVQGPPASTSAAGPSSPRRSPANEDDQSYKAIYLNLDFPVPTREWEGVFDAWVQGDAQSFAELLQSEIKREAEVKEQALERRKRREEEAALATQREAQAEESSIYNAPHEGASKAKGTKRRPAPDLTHPDSLPSAKRRIIVTTTPVDSWTRQNSGRGSSPLHAQFCKASPRSGIFLRIPPRTAIIPEVVIPSKSIPSKSQPTTPLTPPKKATKGIPFPLTPPRTPPRLAVRRRKGKSTTKSTPDSKVIPSVLKKSALFDADDLPLSRRSSVSTLTPSPPPSPQPPDPSNSMMHTLRRGPHRLAAGR